MLLRRASCSSVRRGLCGAFKPQFASSSFVPHRNFSRSGLLWSSAQASTQANKAPEDADAEKLDLASLVQDEAKLREMQAAIQEVRKMPPNYFDFPWEAMKEFSDLDKNLDKAVALPFLIPGKSGVFAMDLFTYASALGELDTVRKQLQELKTVLSRRENSDVVRDKYTTKPEAYEFLRKLGLKFARSVQRELTLMIEKGSFKRVFEVLEAFEELVKAHKFEIDISVAFAKQPTDIKLERVKAETLLHLPRGANPLWDIRIKPELLGGYTVSAGMFFNVDRTVLKDKRDWEVQMEAIQAEQRAELAQIESEDWPDFTDEEILAAKAASLLPKFGAKNHKEFLEFEAKNRELWAEYEKEQFSKYYVDWV